MTQSIGYAWLAETFDIPIVQPLPVRSEIGKRRKTIVDGEGRIEIYTEAMRPDAVPAAQMTFALKHEGVNLAFLARLFALLPPEILVDWVASEPSGQYARRAGFFYEWLTGAELQIDEIAIRGNYRDALNPSHYLTAATSARNSRWRINDNLPGTRAFCPQVRRTPQVLAAERYDCRHALSAVEAEFGEDILRRSAVWLTVRESRASFVIEKEGQESDRIQRFAAAMAHYCGQLAEPLSPSSLGRLQQSILGRSTIEWGLRQSPVFVGSSSLQDGPIVHYVCPHWSWLSAMLGGLQSFLSRTSAELAIVRAAVASFGFVFIHPLADGNGRVSRFLINDCLRRDGATPDGVILPVSATITLSQRKRLEYDRILEQYSRPLMARYVDAVHFGERRRYADGIESDMMFDAYEDAGATWRYPDLTSQVVYLFGVIKQTIESEMPAQASLQRAWYRARLAIKDHLEGPDDHIDRIIRGVRMNGGVSNKLRKEFPDLEDKALADRIESAIAKSFEDIRKSAEAE